MKNIGIVYFRLAEQIRINKYDVRENIHLQIQTVS